MNITTENIYGSGLLITLHMGGYEGRAKMTKEQLKDFPTEIVRGVHDLFDKDFKEQLAKIWSVDMRVRDKVRSKTVPFPIDGVYFLKSDKVEEIINYLEEEKKIREDLVNEASLMYDEAIVRFSNEYPDFYKAAKHKYIPKDEFISRFYFKYQFLKIAPPDKDSVLSPEVYKKEMAKFRESIEDMKREVLSIVAQSLLESTVRLKTQCTEGKPNQRTLDNLNKFLKQIDDVYSDFIDRKDLKDVIANVRASILGVDAESLRSKDDFKKEFKKAISEAAESIKALPDIPLKRSIEF